MTVSCHANDLLSEHQSNSNFPKKEIIGILLNVIFKNVFPHE